MKILNTESSVRFFNKCLLLAFSPLICMIIGVLLANLLGCEGNKCTHDILFFELLDMFLIIVGVYGFFFTIPAALALFIIGKIIDSSLKSSELSYEPASSMDVHASTSSEQTVRLNNGRINKKLVSRKVLINFILFLFLLPGVLILLSGLIWLIR